MQTELRVCDKEDKIRTHISGIISVSLDDVLEEAEAGLGSMWPLQSLHTASFPSFSS